MLPKALTDFLAKPKKFGNTKGQSSIAGLVIGTGVALIMISLVFVLVLNFQGNTLANPGNAIPFLNIFFIVLPAMLIIGILMWVAKNYG